MTAAYMLHIFFGTIRPISITTAAVINDAAIRSGISAVNPTANSSRLPRNKDDGINIQNVTIRNITGDIISFNLLSIIIPHI